jgi:hypothetical protein
MSESINRTGDFNPYQDLGEELLTGLKRILWLTGHREAPVIDEVSGPKAIQRVAVLGRNDSDRDHDSRRVFKTPIIP